jgi:hypothetical protein
LSSTLIVDHPYRLLRLDYMRRDEHGSQASHEGAAVHLLGPPAGRMVGRTRNFNKSDGGAPQK